MLATAVSHVAHFLAQHKMPKAATLPLVQFAAKRIYPNQPYMQFLHEDIFDDMYYS